MGGDIGSPMGDYGDRAAEASEKLGNYQDDWRDREIDRLRAREQELEARVVRLESALSRIEQAPAWGYPERWETTPGEVRQLAREALNEQPRQSAAGLQAEVLERAAGDPELMPQFAEYLRERAKRIREQADEA